MHEDGAKTFAVTDHVVRRNARNRSIELDLLFKCLRFALVSANRFFFRLIESCFSSLSLLAVLFPFFQFVLEMPFLLLQ